MIRGMIRPRKGRTEPGVPVETVRDMWCFWRTPLPGGVCPKSRATPDHNFVDGANNAIFDQFDCNTRLLAGLAVIAQLCCHLCFPRRLGHLTRFVERPGERLFAKHMLATFQGRHSDDSVTVVGSGDDYAIYVFLIEQFTVIAVRPAAFVTA